MNKPAKKPSIRDRVGSPAQSEICQPAFETWSGGVFLYELHAVKSVPLLPLDIIWAHWYDKQDSKRNIFIGGIPSGKGSTLHFLEKKESAGSQYKHMATRLVLLCQRILSKSGIPFACIRDAVFDGSLFRLLSKKQNMEESICFPLQTG